MSTFNLERLHQGFSAWDKDGNKDEDVSFEGRIETDPDFEDWELELAQTYLFDKPDELPAGYSQYNPSGVAVITGPDGELHYVFGARIEPDEKADHIGTSRIVFYEFNPLEPSAKPWIYKTEKSLQRDRKDFDSNDQWNREVDESQRNKRVHIDGMVAVNGEDAWIKRILIEADGQLVPMWQVGATYAFGKWDLDNPDLLFFQERTWLVKDLDDLYPGLEPHSWGPMYQKDIRRSQDEGATSGLFVGRPQTGQHAGQISAAEHPDLANITLGDISKAEVIDETLHPVKPRNGVPVKAGSNDLVRLKIPKDGSKVIRRILDLGHESYGADNAAHYRQVLFEIVVSQEHAEAERKTTIRRIGELAMREHFSNDAKAKQDTERDLEDVLFPGGFFQNENGQTVPLLIDNGYEYYGVTTGVSDGECGWLIMRVKEGIFDQVGEPVAV